MFLKVVEGRTREERASARAHKLINELKRLRKALGMSQRDMALQLDVSVKEVKAFENFEGPDVPFQWVCRYSFLVGGCPEIVSLGYEPQLPLLLINNAASS